MLLRNTVMRLQCNITQHSTGASKAIAVAICGLEEVCNLKMIAAGSSETSLLIYETTRRNSPK
jgi:hypothetical protein